MRNCNRKGSKTDLDKTLSPVADLIVLEGGEVPRLTSSNLLGSTAEVEVAVAREIEVEATMEVDRKVVDIKDIRVDTNRDLEGGARIQTEVVSNLVVRNSLRKRL